MTFDLAGWLIGLLADAGRRRLTTFVLGSEQERALRSAAKSAVRLTAEELPSGSEAQVELVINQVFSEPMPSAPSAKDPTVLDSLQAGIAGQLAVLDNTGLTGAGQSSADVLGVPGSVLADRLTNHLVREIIVRGSGGGPLAPLADQFNHELTRLQIGGMFDRLAAEVRDALVQPDSGVTVAGRLLEEVTDPFVLEVHRPVQPEDAPPGLPVLPPYVPREHDEVLTAVVQAAAGGRNGIAVLVGGSSVGKTRACWEALALLRGQNPGWRLWHPIDPSRPGAVLRELAGVGPRTVVWLNEAQFYLDPAEAGLGERVAAGLRELLRDPGRAPVLVLATLWPGFWDTLTARPPTGAPDPHAQVRELLAGHEIPVPAAFTLAQMSQLARAADVRMVLAARSARDGEVIQFLAGVPELLARHRNAPPAAAALIDAAMDARRLGGAVGLPQAFLEAAAPGYLTDAEWDALGEDWLEQALAYTAVPCKGARGPLTRIRPRPTRHPARYPGDQPSMVATAGPLYRLADYLDQHGREHRADQIPPPEFWSAAAAHAAPGDQAALGEAAHNRGLYRDAVQLHKIAAASGNPRAVSYLSSSLPACLRADPRPLHWTAAHAPLDNPGGVARLLVRLRKAGAHAQAAALLARDPAAHASLDNSFGVAYLLVSLRQAGAHEQLAALLARDPAAHAPLDDPFGVARLLDSLRQAGAHEQAAALAERVGVALDDPGGATRLLDSLRQADPQEQLAALRNHDPAVNAPLKDPVSVTRLLDSLRQAGADEQAAALATQAAAHAPLDNLSGVAHLLGSLRQVGADEQAAALATRAAAHAPLDNPDDVIRLLDSLRQADAQAQATALLARDPGAHAPLGNPLGVAHLLGSLRQAGAHEQAAALAERAAAHAPLDDPIGVAYLLGSLRKAGADEQLAALLARDPAAHAPLDNPLGVAYLLDHLREADADEQLAALLARDPAAHAPLDDPLGVAYLLDHLREAGTDEQLAALLARDPAAHAPLDNLDGLTLLINSLQKAGAHEQAAGLAARAAAHARLDDPSGGARPGMVVLNAARLLDRLRQVGAHAQAAALAERLPAAGMFGLFLKQKGLADQFRFGQEADGTPAAPWGWEDLDLWLVQHEPGTETEEMT